MYSLIHFSPSVSTVICHHGYVLRGNSCLQGSWGDAYGEVWQKVYSKLISKVVTNCEFRHFTSKTVPAMGANTCFVRACCQRPVVFPTITLSPLSHKIFMTDQYHWETAAELSVLLWIKCLFTMDEPIMQVSLTEKNWNCSTSVRVQWTAFVRSQLPRSPKCENETHHTTRICFCVSNIYLYLTDESFL